MIGDETEYLQPVLGLLPTQRFKPLNSSWVAGILLFLIMLLEGAALVVVLFWPKRELQCEPLYLLVYCHAALWLFVLFLDHVLKWHHNKLRVEGYLTAYEKITKYGSLPFYIVSLGNSVLLVLIAVYQQMHVFLEEACTHEWNSPLIVALGFTSFETALLAYILILYLVIVRKFNSVSAPPDVFSPDTWEAFTNHEVGYRERGEEAQALLQKQADTIRYYQNAVKVLNKKVMGLTAQLRGDAIN